MSSYIDPDKHRVPAPQEEEEEEEEDNNDDEMKDIEEVDEETRRIYIPYNINFITKLGKDIYHSDIFVYNKFNIIQLYNSLLTKAKRAINSETYKLI